VDERAVAFLRELARADEDAAATLAELDELAAGVDRVRVRAADLEAFFVRFPADRAAALDASGEAELAAAAAHEELVRAEAEATAAEATRDERRAREARHDVVRARDALAMAERGCDEARRAVESLAEREADCERERAELGVEARRLAAALRARPRLAEQAGEEPVGGLAEIEEWGSAARAALFVARSGLATERDAVLRQANELGTVVLGEPHVGTPPGAIADRLERSS